VLLDLLPYDFPLASLNANIDLHLPTNTVVTSNYLLIPFSGQVNNSTTGQTFIPYNPGYLPLYGKDGLEFQFFVSDYTLSSLVVAYWNQFNAVVSSLPASFPLQLTTDGLAFLIPNLKTTYGKGKPVSLQFTSDPNFGFPQVWTNNSLNFNATLMTQFNVEATPGKWQVALDLLTSVYINANLGVSGTNVTLMINAINVWQVKVINSNCGTVNTIVLNMLLQNLLSILQPIINVELATFPIAIPKIPYVEITADLVVLSNGYTEIAASLAPAFI